MAPLVSVVLWAPQAALGSLVRVEGQALSVLQEIRVPRENVVHLVPLVKMASQGLGGFKDPLELLDLLARRETKGIWGLLATREAKVTREMWAHLDLQGSEVLQAIQASRVLTELRAVGDPLASLDRREMMGSEAS